MCCAVNGDLSQDPDIPSRPKEVQRTPQGRSTTAGSVHCKAEGVILLAACDRRCHRGAGHVGDNQKPEAEDFRSSAQIASICSLGSGSWKSTAAVKAGGSHNRSPTHSCVKYHGAVSRRIVLRPTCCRRFCCVLVSFANKQNRASPAGQCMLSPRIRSENLLAAQPNVWPVRCNLLVKAETGFPSEGSVWFGSFLSPGSGAWGRSWRDAGQTTAIPRTKVPSSC